MDQINNEQFAQSYQKHLIEMADEKNYMPFLRETKGSFYRHVDDNVSVRPPFGRKDYEFFRPDEEIPAGKNQRELSEIMCACSAAYERIGVIRSVVDVMKEFVVKGLEIIHEDEAPNNFYKAWQDRIKLQDRASQAASWSLKAGNFVVRRRFGQLKNKEIDKMKRSNAKFGYIPLEYFFFNPAYVKVLGGDLNVFISEKRYGLKISLSTLNNIRNVNKEIYNNIISQLPEEIKNAIGENSSKILQDFVLPLPADKIYVGHYNKDDTDLWAKSFIYSILSDVYYNDKLKLAKMSALDGIINVIRIWKLGDHTQQMLPSPALGSKLARILEHNTGGGAIDIIWDSMIELEEFYPPIEKLVNFEESYHSILLGLGVPQGMVGGESDSKGQQFTYLGLKNMVTRIESVRRLITEWLNQEIDIIQEAMNFKKRPYIRYAYEDLQEEKTYFDLLLQLVDRNIISDTRILEVIKELPEFEKLRVFTQEQERTTKERPPKAGPYNNPQLDDQRKHEVKMKQMDIENSNNQSKEKPKESSRPGRPVNKKDSRPRKRSPNRVKTIGSDLVAYALKTENYIDDYLTNLIMLESNVTDFRKLTAEQKLSIEQAKLALLPRITPHSILSEENIVIFSETNNDAYLDFIGVYNDTLIEIGSDNITSECKRLAQIQSYCLTWGVIDGED